ncbi:MAG: helix-turn-helix transcriptional regulator [Gemmatimonadaceae bacterium]
MLSSRLGALLRAARRSRNLSRAELSQHAEVSVRLIAELERGERPNVSLETALRLLSLVGLSMSVTPGEQQASGIRGSSDAAIARVQRAARRRQTWTGRHVKLSDAGEEPRPVSSAAGRVASVAEVSRLAYAVATAGKKATAVKADRKAAR